jgi:hypothetical protein
MQRPTAVTVFGFLNIAFGILGVVCTPASLASSLLTQPLLENIPESQRFPNPVGEMMSDPAFMTYMYVSVALGMVVSAVLLVSGLGLLKLRPWARYFSLGYAVYAWVSVIIGTIISYYLAFGPMLEKASEMTGPESAAYKGGMIGGAFGTVFGMCFGLVYPTVLFIFMLLPDVKAAFKPGWGAPPPVPPGMT